MISQSLHWTHVVTWPVLRWPWACRSWLYLVEVGLFVVGSYSLILFEALIITFIILILILTILILILSIISIPPWNSNTINTCIFQTWNSPSYQEIQRVYRGEFENGSEYYYWIHTCNVCRFFRFPQQQCLIADYPPVTEHGNGTSIISRFIFPLNHPFIRDFYGFLIFFRYFPMVFPWKHH